MNSISAVQEQLEEIDVAHICLFEEGTGKVLMQFNEKFQMFSFVGGKCDGKNQVDTILDEMGDEIGYSFFSKNIFEVLEMTRTVGGKICNGKVFVGELPKGFVPVDLNMEGESKFYDIKEAPLDNFITGDTKEEVLKIIRNCSDILKNM